MIELPLHFEEDPLTPLSFSGKKCVDQYRLKQQTDTDFDQLRGMKL